MVDGGGELPPQAEAEMVDGGGEVCIPETLDCIARDGLAVVASASSDLPWDIVHMVRGVFLKILKTPRHYHEVPYHDDDLERVLATTLKHIDEHLHCVRPEKAREAPALVYDLRALQRGARCVGRVFCALHRPSGVEAPGLLA